VRERLEPPAWFRAGCSPSAVERTRLDD
jgi:hypothetical protein